MQSQELELIAEATASWKRLKKGRWRDTASASAISWETLVLKDETIAECLVVSLHGVTLKHKAEQQFLTQKRLISAASENKRPFPG